MVRPHGSKGLRQGEGGTPGAQLAWKVRRAQGLTKTLPGPTSTFGHESLLWGIRGPPQAQAHPPAGARSHSPPSSPPRCSRTAHQESPGR